MMGLGYVKENSKDHNSSATRQTNREMELKVAEDKSWPRREYLRTSRGRNQKAVVSNILDAIARVKGTGEVVCEPDENGAVRMKIVVKKEDLKQVLEAMRDDGKSISRQYSSSAMAPKPTSMSLEHRLNLMRKRHIMRTTQLKIRQRSSWRPALQSIPEEL